jgi:DNA-binding SARP family transcriptional activator/tetratricopeptide (TPR) repeat protein
VVYAAPGHRDGTGASGVRGDMAEYRLLGPVEVSASGQQIDLGQPRQRTVLAALLIDAGRMVTVETLIDRVWGQAPPVTARHTLYSHIARVRQVLARVSAADAVTARLVHRSGGYLLDVDRGLVDLHRFRDLTERSRGPQVPDEERARLLGEALALWRGEPLAGLSGEWIVRAREAWHQQHVDTVIAWAQTELRLDHPHAVLGPLTDLAGEHTLVEALAAVLMRALHVVGRTAEALNRYATIRQRLVEELGVDPGADLQATHQAILRGELGPPPTASAVPARVPAQLPADVTAFVGRRDELADLDRLVDGGTGSPDRAGESPAVVISAVSGTAGVGKTALAIHWAHRNLDRFPDGHLYVNLRGYDPGQPVAAADALAWFLNALGVAVAELPHDLPERAARYRTELSRRRMLVLLDNAATAEQVRPLLPGTGRSTVLITSRDRLPGLVAVDGAHRLDLDLLPPADAITLLRRIIGGRVDAEPDAAATLVQQCAQLPLALRVAAEFAAARPSSPLAELVTELADHTGRLAALAAGGDERAAVTSVFSWSLRQLPEPAARTFRLLGLHPGPDFDAYVAAALSGDGLASARRTLNLLAGTHLIELVGTQRFAMHDLLRAYAASLAEATEAMDELRAAQDRLFDYYLGVAANAMNCLYPAEAHRRPQISTPGSPTPALPDPQAAYHWLDNELRCLTAVAAYTATHGWPRHTTRLAATLFRYLDGGHPTEASAVHTYAWQVAEREGDQDAQAQALIGLGAADMHIGRNAAAADNFDRALTLFRQAGDHTGEARALSNLGNIDQRVGRYTAAADHYGQALTLFRQTGDHTGEARALTNLGNIQQRTGRYELAAEHHSQALHVIRAIGDRNIEAYTLNNLGEAEISLDRHESAAHHHAQALNLFRQIGNRPGEATALDNLGVAHARLGRFTQADNEHQLALALHHDIGNRDGEAWTLNSAGETAQAAGRATAAQTHHATALHIAESTGARDQQARAHAGLGRAHHSLGDLASSREHLTRAVTLYRELGMAQADQTQALLASLDAPT